MQEDEFEALRQAEADAATFRRDVGAVIRAQQQQIAVLERQAQQLANEAAAEQRYNSALTQNAGASKLTRMQQEHTKLSLALEQEGRHAMELARAFEVANSNFEAHRDDVTRLEAKRLQTKKIATGPLAARVMRTLSQSDDMVAAAVKLHEEVDHLRKERLVFLEKLRDLELQITEQQEVNMACEGSIRTASSRRDTALSHARQMEDTAQRRSRLRHAQRQQMTGQLHAVELQARQARSKLREKMISATNAATVLSLCFSAS